MRWQRRGEEVQRVGDAVRRFVIGSAVVTLSILIAIAAHVANGQQAPEPPTIIRIVPVTDDPCTGVTVVSPEIVEATAPAIDACVEANPNDDLGCVMAGMRLRAAIARAALGCEGAERSVEVEGALLGMLTEAGGDS